MTDKDRVLSLWKNIFILLVSMIVSGSLFASEFSKTSFTKTRTINVDKERVWSALTNEQELGKWWNEGVILEPFVGGQFYEPWGEGQLATGIVLSVEPLRSIKFTWKEKYWDKDQETQCEFSIVERDGSTLLEVRHSGWETFEDLKARKTLIEAFKGGWDFYLSKLFDYLSDNSAK